MMKKSSIALSIMLACMQSVSAMEASHSPAAEQVLKLMTEIENHATSQWRATEVTEEIRGVVLGDALSSADYTSLVRDNNLLGKLLALIDGILLFNESRKKEIAALVKLICGRLPFASEPGLISQDTMRTLVDLCVHSNTGAYELAQALRSCAQRMIQPADSAMLATLTVPAAGPGTLRELFVVLKGRLGPGGMSLRGVGEFTIDETGHFVRAEPYEKIINDIIEALSE